MRFQLTLQTHKQAFGDKIPINYAYELSSLIYRILSKSDTDFSQWLHKNGFQLGNKKFKLFSFSRLNIPKYRIEGDCIRILSNTIHWQISFLPERSTQEFIQGIFQNQLFELGVRNANIQFSVNSISLVPSPIFTDKMQMETLSPICIVLNKDIGKQQYISPEHPEAEKLILLNLLDKYRAFHGYEFPEKDFPFSLKTLSSPKPSLITIKAGTPQESKIRGFMVKFQLQAPIELMQIAYEAGIGGKNSMGFGMIKAL